MAFMCQETITRSGSLARTDLVALNHSTRDYQRPIELTAERLRTQR